MTNFTDPSALLPLSPQVYGVLLILADRSLHGYGIIREFETRTGQEDVLLPGSLYNTLGRMVTQELVEEVPSPGGGTDERRRYYRATVFGRTVAQAESARLRSLLTLAEDQGLAGESAA